MSVVSSLRDRLASLLRLPEASELHVKLSSDLSVRVSDEALKSAKGMGLAQEELVRMLSLSVPRGKGARRYRGYLFSLEGVTCVRVSLSSEDTTPKPKPVQDDPTPPAKPEADNDNRGNLLVDKAPKLGNTSHACPVCHGEGVVTIPGDCPGCDGIGGVDGLGCPACNSTGSKALKVACPQCAADKKIRR